MTGIPEGYGPPDRKGNSYPKIEFRILKGMVQHNLNGEWVDAREATKEEVALITQLPSTGTSVSCSLFTPGNEP